MITKSFDTTIFLSSLCKEVMDIRAKIYELVNSNKELPHLYVDEIDSPRSPDDLKNEMLVVSQLAEKLSKSKLVVVIVSDVGPRLFDHGSLIDKSEVSFWEIELYHAAILQIPTYIIIERGIDTYSRKLLTNVFQILPSLSENIIIEDRGGIADTVYNLICAVSQPKYPKIAKYLNCLQGLRKSPFDPKYKIFDKEASSLQFRSLVFADKRFNESKVKHYIELASNEEHFQLRISLLYIAYRELLKEPFWDNIDEAILSHWLSVSFKLSEDLRWYGFHGHLQMGVIHHACDYGIIQSILMDRGEDVIGKLPYSCYGAFASEYYSLYKYIKGDNLNKAYENIKQGLNSGFGEADKYRIISIRGACHLTSFQFNLAKDDFESVINFLEIAGNEKNEIAHMYVKLGIATFFTWRFNRGFDLARKGLSMFSGDSADKVRSLRILAFMYKITGRLRSAKKLSVEASEIAARIGAFDQVRKIKLKVV